MDKSELAQKLKDSKDGAYHWQKRRHPDWTENYTLYRDKVIVNRLIQRQSVNIPLMKQSIRTVLANIDDPPELYFANIENDKQREIYFNENWKNCAERNKLEIKDIVDKKNVCLYGRSFKKLNILEGKFYFSVHDPFDMLVDRYADPADIDTAQFVIHQHIYKTLDELKNSVNYDQDEVLKIERYFASEEGLIQATENLETARAKNERLRRMGAEDLETPLLGEVWVELNENFIKLWDEEKKKYVINFVISCDQALDVDATGNEVKGLAILFVEPLPELIGKTVDDFWENHYPITWWGDDIEGTDIWSDAIADILRTPNKVLNAWFSQLVENRTLRNLGMRFYDATKEGFVPETFEPIAFGWYPSPGNPNEVIKEFTIPDLSESLDEMNFLIQLAEKATAATAIQQGVSQPQKITLGEVEILQRNVTERIRSMAVFYNNSWRDFGLKYVKMIEAAGDKLDEEEISIVGYQGNVFTKKIGWKELKAKKGYKVKVMQMADKIEQDTEMLQGLNASLASMPNNVPLRRIYNEKLLDLAKCNPEERKEVMDFEEQNRQAMENMMLTTQTGQQQMAGTVRSDIGQGRYPREKALAQFPELQGAI